MAKPAHEILTTARFYVGLFLDGSDEAVDGYFQECKGLKASQDVIECPEVVPLAWGRASHGQFSNVKIPGNLKLSNITLVRSLRSSKTLWNWLFAVQNGAWAEQRRDGAIVIYRQDASEGARFAFERAWPSSYKCSDVTATGSDLAVEELEIVCEVFERVDPGGETN